MKTATITYTDGRTLPYRVLRSQGARRERNDQHGPLVGAEAGCI
jgi:hypothetical protein